MIKLGVNIDHIATLRQARRSNEPDPVHAAVLCELAGADSIVAHLREDRRHIQDRDVRLLKETVKTRLNLEMSIDPSIVRIAAEVKPAQATLVPEKRQELTTEGGLDVIKNFSRIKQAVGRLENAGIAVSIFIDPDPRQIDAASRMGVKRIELHTGRYADAMTEDDRAHQWRQLEKAAEHAHTRAMEVFAGHGLDYRNVTDICAIAGIRELNIGYSIICRASFVGLEEAVRQMKTLMSSAAR